MLNSKLPKGEQLVPLSVLAEESPYQLTYLSILVQRKKLKAKKIGKKYYSKRIWLEEYMDAHSNKANESFSVMQESLPKTANILGRAKAGIFGYFQRFVKLFKGSDVLEGEGAE